MARPQQCLFALGMADILSFCVRAQEPPQCDPVKLKISEGEIVTCVSLIVGEKHYNTPDGENEGYPSNNIHIDICSCLFEAGKTKTTKMNDRSAPSDIAGQLFYDAGHKLGRSSNRASVWDIHSICAMQICHLMSLQTCPSAKQNDKSIWMP